MTNTVTHVMLIKDFSSKIPNATVLYNDVEGDSSNDSDHWAWMAVHYDGSSYIVDAFVHYQISTDTIDTLLPGDLAGTNLNIEKDRDNFTHRPNMVEMSPNGSGIVIHYDRMWDDSAYGGNGAPFINTWFDGPHLWPIGFGISQQEPVKISVSSTHSGWAFDTNGVEYFISQNNRTDKLDAVVLNGSSTSFDDRMEIASHSHFGWSNGFHYGKMPHSRPGWAFVNTYSNVNDVLHNSDWGADQLLMIQLKPESEAPLIWRIGHNYNRYDGDYYDEAPAAINLVGNRIYVSNNWGGLLGHREIFLYELPNDWDTQLNNLN